jgi:hypothetical protein
MRHRFAFSVKYKDQRSLFRCFTFAGKPLCRKFPGGRLDVAAGMQEPCARRLHLPKPVGRIHRSAELSEEDLEEDAEVGRGLGTAKADLSLIRRTIATLAQKKGTPKDVQSVLRYSRLAATTDVYMQEIPESVKATVEAINKELRSTPQLVEAS